VRRIIDEGTGAVVSEFPPGTPPDAVNFPRRNRIVAGLSLGVLVAEARSSGGALLTAMAALEQNREVFAAPAPLFTEMDGANRLIQDGAQLVTGVEDILSAIGPILGQPAGGPAAPAPAAEVVATLPAAERTLFDVLSPEPLSLDEICVRAQMAASSALVYLLQLEFRGLVRQLAGKRFHRG
jgi:DNA processing protein